MTPLFKKLNFKQQKEILILKYPPEFEGEMKAMEEYTTIQTDINEAKHIHFALVFVKTQSEIEGIAPAILRMIKDDGVIWFAYPKGTSKKYKVEINRDKGWEILAKLGLRGIRSIAINEDWSAVRFRRVEFIKAMTRKIDFRN